MRFIFLAHLFFLGKYVHSKEIPSADKTCIGRFLLSPPPSWSIRGRFHKSYHTNFSENLTPAIPNDSNDIIKKSKSTDSPEMLFLISQKKNHHEVQEKISIAPFSAMILTKAKDSEFDREALALHGNLKKGVLLRSLFSSGKEKVMHSLLTKLIEEAYQPDSRQGFCLETGALHGDPSRSETVLLVFDNPADPQSRSLVFETTTVAKAQESAFTSWLERVGLKRMGVDVTILRDRGKTVAGLSGREVISRVIEKEGAAPWIQFRYQYVGTPGDSMQPALRIEMKGLPEEKESLEKIWDTFLDSIEKGIPAPPKKKTASH